MDSNIHAFYMAIQWWLGLDISTEGAFMYALICWTHLVPMQLRVGEGVCTLCVIVEFAIRLI